MAAPGVAQLGPLSQLFARALRQCRPRSVAVLGVAGGNGLEHITGSGVDRVVGVDINPAYLEEVSRRYGEIAALELCCADIARQQVPAAPVDLVHAALILEHTGLEPALSNALALVAPAGHLSVVLQLRSAAQVVTPTQYESMQTLRDHVVVIDNGALRSALHAAGFGPVEEARGAALPSGKGFWLGIFARTGS